jgi:hypothetical protein
MSDADDLGAEAISNELGCSIQTAREALLRFGFYRHRPWTEIEKTAVRVFYPQFQACLIAQALNRTNWSVWQSAARTRIKSETKVPRAPSEEESSRFWHLWRQFVRRHFRKHPDRNAILKLTWRPPAHEETCDTCSQTELCRNGVAVLPCEKMTVRDVIVQEGVRSMAYTGQGRLRREKWSVIPESRDSHFYYAERFVDGELQQEWINGHCLACAKTEVLNRRGGQVDLRGWHMAAAACGLFLLAAQRAIDEETKLKTCLLCGSPVAEVDLMDEMGRTVEEGGEIEDCVLCPHCDNVFRAQEDLETAAAGVGSEEKP